MSGGDVIADGCVLIPGAGQGGWLWQPVAERLCAAGHPALPVTLPGMGACGDRAGVRLADATAHVVDEIDRRDHDRVVLVAHSLGGVVLASVAARLGTRVAAMVFVSAYVPLPGEAFVDTRGQAGGERLRSAIGAAPDATTSIPFEAFAASVMPGEPESAQRIVHNLMTPTPGGYALDPYEGPDLRTTGIPARLVLAEDDHALALPGSELAARLGVAPGWVPGTHMAPLTHPDQVAAAVLGR